MKTLLFICFSICCLHGWAQTKPADLNTNDSLILYRYIGGKPSLKHVNAEKKVAENWGFKIAYFFGDCAGTYDYKEDEFKILNEKSYPLFTLKFGQNWAEKFYTEVENLLKKEK